MRDPNRGIYYKFKVERTDGKSAPGQKHDGCFYFVLDCDHDPHAKAALLAYADSCEAAYPALASDVRAIVAGGAAFGSGEDKRVADVLTIRPTVETEENTESSRERVTPCVRERSERGAETTEGEPVETEATQSCSADNKTPCAITNDGLHCECWYEGGACCGCGDGGRTLRGEPTCAEIRAQNGPGGRDG